MATMNDCKKIQPLLSEYVDGELTEETAWTVKLHLSSCAVCGRIADDFAATARLVASLPEPKGPSEGFEAALARRIADQMLVPKPLSAWDKVRLWFDEATNPASHPQRRPMVLATATALAAAIPAVIFFTHQTQLPGPPTPPSLPPVTTAQIVVSDPALSELWNEHAAFSSAQPLGDPATNPNTDGLGDL